VGTLLMVISGILPIMNNLISQAVDLQQIPYNGFPNMDVAVFQYSLLILPFTLIPAVFLRAYWVTYLIPIFSYTNIICLYTFYHFGIVMDSDLFFYTTVAGISIIIFLIYGTIREYFFTLTENDNLDKEILELYENELMAHEK
jgi:hypothetical protein